MEQILQSQRPVIFYLYIAYILKNMHNSFHAFLHDHSIELKLNWPDQRPSSIAPGAKLLVSAGYS